MKKLRDDFKTKYKASALLIISLLLYISSYIMDECCSVSVKNHLFYKIVISLLITFASIIGVSFLWELVNKKSFANEILQLNGVSDNYTKSGIVNIYENYNDIDWNEKLKNAYSVCFYFSYARGWRSRNRKNLLSLKQSGTKIQVVLPNLDNTELMDEYDRRFRYGKYASNEADKEKSTKSNIKDAIQYFKELEADIYLINMSYYSTYYVIDKKIIFAPFNHNFKQGNVPAIECEKDGTFYEFCKYDTNAILENAEVYDYDKKTEE